MNSTTSFSSVFANNLVDQTSVSQTQKFLVFPIGKLNLALSVPIVEKVLNYTPIHSSGTTASGIIHLENRSVMVIDLYKRLFNIKQSGVSQTKQFLILARNTVNESFGILINESPTLFDVSLSQIRVLPDSYRQSDTLSIASHVMIIPYKDESLTVFLLDGDRLVNPG